jgi:hypothetical protein
MLPNERQALGLWTLAARLDESRRVCPVCKAVCSVPTLVPVYVRSDPVIEKEKNKGETSKNNDTTRENKENEQEKETRASNNNNSNANNAQSAPQSPSLRDELDTIHVTTVNEETPQRANSTLRQRVPARPAATTPSRQLASTASLSQGLVGSFQSVLRTTPPLHRGPAYASQHRAFQQDQDQIIMDNDPAATEFLSRLLLMLGSFVIFCLLLF